MPELDDLDELQLVTKREFRRGYQAQVNGELTRLKYGKAMTTPDGHVLVYRPAIGQERRKDRLWGLPRILGIFFVVAWPITILVLIGIVILIDLGFRALFR